MRLSTDQPNRPGELETVYLESCPKCDSTYSEALTECPRCGLIYAKFRPPHLTPATAITFEDSTRSGSVWRERLLSTPSAFNPLVFAGRLVLLLVLIIWGWRFMTSTITGGYAATSFLHLVNLPFHEAGHLFFGFFGHLIMSLGGTLGQVLMPCLSLCALLFKTRDAFGAAVALWWVGQNFIDIAPYINDARSRQLMLLGGVTGRDAAYGYHDWEYILGETGWLRYDHTLASIAHGVGIVVMLAAFVWAGAVLCHQWRRRLHVF